MTGPDPEDLSPGSAGQARDEQVGVTRSVIGEPVIVEPADHHCLRIHEDDRSVQAFPRQLAGQRDIGPAASGAHRGRGLPHAFPAGEFVAVAFSHYENVRPAALIPGDPHQPREVVTPAGTVGVVMPVDQAAVLVVEIAEIDLSRHDVS